MADVRDKERAKVDAERLSNEKRWGGAKTPGLEWKFVPCVPSLVVNGLTYAISLCLCALLDVWIYFVAHYIKRAGCKVDPLVSRLDVPSADTGRSHLYCDYAGVGSRPTAASSLLVFAHSLLHHSLALLTPCLWSFDQLQVLFGAPILWGKHAQRWPGRHEPTLKEEEKV